MKTMYALAFMLLIAVTTQAQNNYNLIVKIKAGINYQLDYNTKKIIQPALASIAIMNSLTSLSSMMNRNAVHNDKLKKTELIRDIHFIGLPNGADVEATISILQATGIFEYVEKDGIGTGAGVQLTTPDDPFFASAQWSLKNVGTFSGTAINDADIDMDNAWDFSTGIASTIVCVLDAGFKMDHPELAGRIWQNADEIAGNGLDDDANGYIDDVSGWDFANNDNNPADDHGHGTNVASILCAKGNNTVGIAGINWNCTLMVGKILNASNSGLYSWWASGIYYAVNNGARVINMSVGGSGFSASMQNACDFAMANNVIIVACMQNQNTVAPYYPAAYSSVIAVGSTSDNDNRTVPFPWSSTSGSNYGNHIDLVAPGNLIIGANYASNSSYTYWSGTSQATPEVAGVISLMLALKPDLTFAQVMTVLTTTSQDLVGNPLEDLPGWDQYYGAGRLNAAAALSAVMAIIPLQFKDFTARRKGNVNELVWSTFSENNTSEFILEHSADRSNWHAFKTLAAAGNSTTEKLYTAHHVTDNKTDAFYRIKVIDKDGSFTYSKIARVNKNQGNLLLSIDKIITDRNTINIYVSAAEKTNAAWSLYSMEGKLIYKTNQWIEKGSSIFAWKVRLTPGSYQLLTIAQNQKISRAILIK